MSVIDNDVDHQSALRPEIALSWHRAQLSGLSPAAADLPVEQGAVDRRSALMVAAQPVLAELAQQLDGASYCVVLADRQSRIMECTAGSTQLRERLAALGVVRGGVFREETTGTNSIATAHELRQGITVRGYEHYLEAFKPYSCYGQPIFHPATRRLQGILDITCSAGDESPLLKPFLGRAVQEISERLLAAARYSQQRLLNAFQVACSERRRAVVACGDGMTLVSDSAAELLEPHDHLRLRELATELIGRDSANMTAPLSQDLLLFSGRSVTVRGHRVDGGCGVLFDLTLEEARLEQSTSRPRQTELARGEPLYIGGEPGTGRTTRARSIAQTTGQVAVFDAADLLTGDPGLWCGRLEAAAANDSTSIVVENVHALSHACSTRLARLVNDSRSLMVVTGPPVSNTSGHIAALAASCPQQVELPRLRDRIDELSHLLHDMLREAGADDTVRFTPATHTALAGHSWPGNLRELRGLVTAILRARKTGDITLNDLPAEYRTSHRLSRLTPLERAEHDTIRAVLERCGGNKLQAARELGISRTTLYNRMRALKL
ncbi:helix-turn-helix domain-containing protein [Saccharopolyspora sp. NPDC049426]|uniref:sigma-54-dependent Fis family transcriptional regulator n=1 Tax=Saccharopolyspora sp. NPDC049426 TaxID=3155652 RepID=UPI003428F6E3